MSQSAFFKQPTGAERDSAGVALARQGYARLTDVADAEQCAALRAMFPPPGAWTREEGDGRACETAPAAVRLREELSAFFSGLGLTAPVITRLLRHGPFGYGLPPQEPGATGFLLDLNEDWRSEHGGLLLMGCEAGVTHGWRPEAGALTVFSTGAAPLLTLVTPHAPGPRTAVFGALAAS